MAPCLSVQALIRPVCTTLLGHSKGICSSFPDTATQPEGNSVCAQKAPARLGFPGALPQRRVVWMWFGAFPGAFGLGRAQPQRRGTSP